MKGRLSLLIAVVSLATTAGALRSVVRSSASDTPAISQDPSGSGPHVRAILPELRLRQVPLGQALQMLSRESGATISVNWSALEDSDVADWLPVDVDLRNVSVLAALDRILDQVHNLGYHVDHDTIHIDSSRDRPEVPTPPTKVVTAMYDVRGLFGLSYSSARPGPVDRGPMISNTLFVGSMTLPPGVAAPPPAFSSIPDEWEGRFRLLSSMLSRCFDLPSDSIQYCAGHLIVVAPQSDQTQIARLLREMKTDLPKSPAIPSP